MSCQVISLKTFRWYCKRKAKFISIMVTNQPYWHCPRAPLKSNEGTTFWHYGKTDGAKALQKFSFRPFLLGQTNPFSAQGAQPRCQGIPSPRANLSDPQAESMTADLLSDSRSQERPGGGGGCSARRGVLDDVTVLEAKKNPNKNPHHATGLDLTPAGRRPFML